MLSQKKNNLLTRVGKGTGAGSVLRQYWQPVALEAEFDASRPVTPVDILGERLVAFRDDTGRYGLLHRQCPHRGADLCFGRLEDGGLRCAFHGWLFDVHGHCVEQPAEPIDSRFHTRVRQDAYPCEVRAGTVFAFMGEGPPPPLPELDCLRAPASHSFAFKGLMECNWLQALEVGIDPAHASFLHRFLDHDGLDYGMQFRDLTDGANMPVTELLRNYPRPSIEVETTDYGTRIFAHRELSDTRRHVRVTNQIFPQAILIPMSTEMTITQWHVPVDDEHCYWYAVFTSFGDPVDHQRMREQRLALYELPGYTSRRNKRNNYGYDPEEQRTRTFTGMGEDINVHDQWAVESMGAIQDRTREHLGKSDVAIRAYRRQLLQAIDTGGYRSATRSGEPVLALDGIVDRRQWRSEWRSRALARRRICGWIKECA
jgi:phenylpropionate dioxygenase-like ring-hydroxylating dioxygenase large terminal subunit